MKNLKSARSAIGRLKGVSSPLLPSAVYETEPVDCEEGAGVFLNAVIEFGYEGKPTELLNELRQIEASLDRPNRHARNESRTLDLDLLYFDDLRLKAENLVLPHPRVHLRAFVLVPLADIRPDLVLPGQERTVRELLASLSPAGKVLRLTSDWGSP